MNGAGKQCGGCTVCCTVCVVPDFDKKAGERCIKLNGNGCSIYGAHPQVCKDFECAYYQGGNNIALRPDKCGVMFIKKNERIFCGIAAPDIGMTDFARGQGKSFIEQGYSLVMLSIGERPRILLADGHNSQEIYKEYTGVLNGNL